jgi:hypothetical protein
MTKHTPGPWRIAADMHGIGNMPVHGVEAADGTAIANCGKWKGAEANARLIAAAPELLDQLAQCLAVMRDYRTGLIDTSNLEGLEQLEYAGHALIDRIRK